MNRRKFLKAGATLSATGLLAGLYAWKVEPYWLEFVHRKMPIAHLPASLRGKTLLQISDMHVGDRFDFQYIINAFNDASKLDPAIVVYTGDFVSYDGPQQLEQLKTVMENAVHGSVATLGILGNHDYGKNWQEPEVDVKITKLLEEAGVTVLRNAKANVEGLTITGLDDLWGTNYEPGPILSSLDKQSANLVLCHNPDVCDQDVWHDYQGWILSGHTHGGQCKPPFLPPPLLPVENRRYTSGYFDLEDGRHLYINRALGCSFPVRFNVRPEITVFELA
ncbi:metallophosphoesterase [Lewinella sp. 4G2]|uniref:metallophosphoesterase n=1 Tax=Lewinella sp. 4G2 TaxID=1803372 RepID=UPI0007B4E239|nr:metallophosphoesterase [Lewinella sp. 4G2]OAV43380.1 phosphoesterase [Lewinella sp. 4G2]